MTPLETLLARHGPAPVLAVLGGEDHLWTQADELTTSRLWFRAAESLLAEWDSLRDPEHAALFITEALAAETRPAVTGDVLDRLCEHPGYLEHHAAHLGKLAIDRAQSHTTVIEAEVAGLFLEVALRLALAGSTNRYMILASLVDPQTTTAPLGYARRVVRALGAAYEQWRDPDLAAALHPFLDIPGLRSDTAYELAMCHLADAFNAPDRTGLLSQLDVSRALFSDAIAADEDRSDATAYRAAINAVLAFHAGDNNALATAAEQLRRATTEHALWLTGLRTHWRDGRYDTEAAWCSLSTNLERASSHLATPLTTWPGHAIQHILEVYTAHRSLRLTYSDSAPGYQLLVAPRIEDAFLNREGLLLHLRGLLADAPPDWDAEAAEQLLSAVDSRLQHDDAHEQLLQDRLGKGGAVAYPDLAAALGNNILAALPATMIQSIQDRLTDDDATLVTRLPAAQQDIFNDVVAVLNGCPDFQPGPIRHHFVRLITLTIRFLSNRTNRSRAHHTTRTSYLYTPTAGQKLPLENTLQEWLDGNLEDVDIEITDRSGGRADVVVRSANTEFIIECKRTTGKTTRRGLRRYLGQAAAYQAGGTTLGMLAVLDLTPKPDWIPNIRDNMWADHIPAPQPEQRDRWVAVLRVPGNRTTPHDM